MNCEDLYRTKHVIAARNKSGWSDTQYVVQKKETESFLRQQVLLINLRLNSAISAWQMLENFRK